MADDGTATTDLPWTGERFIPGVEGNVALEHIHRYLVARELASGKDVLDIACGEGYGSALLAEVARHVTGVDIAREAIEHACGKYLKENLEFAIGACAQMPVADASIDLLVSFETIEHHDQHEAMMAEITRVLRLDGVLVISSPEKHEYSEVPGFSNPFHVRELYRHEFKRLLDAHFKNVAMFGQRIIYGSGIFLEQYRGEVLSYETRSAGKVAGMRRPQYLVAVASDAPLPPLSGSFFEQPVAESADVKPLISALAEREQQFALLEQVKAQGDSQLSRLSQAVAQRDGQIAALNETAAARDNHIAELARTAVARNEQIASLASDMRERDERIATLNQVLSASEHRVHGLEAEAALREKHIEGLSGTLSQLSEQLRERQAQIAGILKSRSWRLTHPLRVLGRLVKRV